MSIFGPIVTAMVTPFNEDGTVNYKQAVELMDYLIQNKTTTMDARRRDGHYGSLTADLWSFTTVVEGALIVVGAPAAAAAAAAAASPAAFPAAPPVSAAGD